jgi:hypothetical protein
VQVVVGSSVVWMRVGGGSFSNGGISLKQLPGYARCLKLVGKTKLDFSKGSRRLFWWTLTGEG